jgi:hypothetical protein
MNPDASRRRGSNLHMYGLSGTKFEPGRSVVEPCESPGVCGLSRSGGAHTEQLAWQPSQFTARCDRKGSRMAMGQAQEAFDKAHG